MHLLRQIFGNSNDSTTLSPAAAHSRLSGDHPPYLLDVREPDEFRAEHIDGAKLIPLGQINARLHELPKDREIVCICRSGARSSVAARHLAAAGYRTLNLSGGMIGWQRAGLPVKRGTRR
jgi:rhodanese-related sulfurtransferase